ncbi:Ribose transport system permease protein RbsC [Limihaloglobus sulfuriphilus]|uniref:Ribose transport system permease protein RbsC n=1 Tax=Limihaloglobus sulfuriphilus TaxID=1851148 RepID=A0A1Q2MIQ3_9BACT|nr:ABC transporter permease [Limihaloglobus sulfuriphilus]AQQ72544.1 Ribose transport system permease protein RbsC [Limihaloglobus sulfuriphilus]
MNKMIRQMLPFGTLILIVCILSAIKPDSFLTLDNFLNVLRRSSVNGIIAVGMTFIIISAGIDLSVGSVAAFCGMAGAWTMLKVSGGDLTAGSMVIGTLAGMFAGLVCGFFNGTLITSLKLQPFIVTLGSMSIFRGISYVMHDGQPFNVPQYKYLGEGVIAGVPVSIIIFALVTGVAAFIMKYTRLGRYTYAMGSNQQAAFHAGINVKKNLVAIYSLTGLLVGLAAMILTSRTVSAQPTAGIQLELDVIAAVVIGGASLSGGCGGITGTIIGTLLISFLRNGCTLLGISTNVQLIVIGIIIIAAVAIDQVARSKAADSTN